MLGPVTNYNPELMKALFSASPYVETKDEKHQKKLQRADYLDRSIAFVVDSHIAAVSSSEDKQENSNSDEEPKSFDYEEYFAPITEYDFTDDGNAERFLSVYGDRVAFCDAENTWYVYNGKCWRPDKSKSELKRISL